MFVSVPENDLVENSISFMRFLVISAVIGMELEQILIECRRTACSYKFRTTFSWPRQIHT